MLSTQVVLLALAGYVGMLLIIAWLGQQGNSTLNRLAESPVTYTLSLAVYCTSWTFYGSVGKAATSGMSFLAIYFGPTLAMLFAGVMMRRLIHLKNDLRITSIADFLAARYFRSQQVATLVTFMAVLGAVPYISLQLKAVNSSLGVLGSHSAVHLPDLVISQLPLISAACLALFTILFGVRRLDPTERHPGIILALVFECVVKLAAFMAVGIFVCFYLFDSPMAMLELAAKPEHQITNNLTLVPTFFQWTTLMVLSASAFFFLPRQFHVAVVENSNPDHFKTAQWGFPLYILLINLFVIPIALAGLLLNYGPEQADTFVLLLPLNHGDPLLALFAFVGGISAALGMVMICAMAISTMMINHMLLPLIEQLQPLNQLRRYLLQLRWLAVVVIILGGYLFNTLVGESYMLVNIGLISFAAVAQFIPATLGGLFWDKGTRRGALWGLSAGFVTWLYCLVLPTFVHSGWLSAELLTSGPFGISWLRPEALFDLAALDSLSHGVFWSLSFNLGGYLVGSLSDKLSTDERYYYQQFMTNLEETAPQEEVHLDLPLEETIPLEQKRELSLNLLNRYMPAAEAVNLLRDAELNARITGKSHCNLFSLAELGKQLDQRLSGVLGAAVSAKVLRRAKLLTKREQNDLQNYYSKVISELRISPAELKQKVNFYRERQALIVKHSEELEQKVEERTTALQEANLSLANTLDDLKSTQGKLVEAEKMVALASLVTGLSHEINTPLGVCVTSSSSIEGDLKSMIEAVKSGKLSERVFTSFCDDTEAHLKLITENLDKACSLVQTFRCLSAHEGDTDLRKVDLCDLITEFCAAYEHKILAGGHSTTTRCQAEHPTTITTFPASLLGAMEYLIDNALSHAFSDGRSGEINFEVNKTDTGAIITYRDNGIGLSEEMEHHLFEPFSTSQRGIGKIGLGGHIFYILISQKLEGSIELRNHPNKGLEIDIILPDLAQVYAIED